MSEEKTHIESSSSSSNNNIPQYNWSKIPETTDHQNPNNIPRVLSIQSSVVYGYVGNKASNFPLQLLGFDVDPIHSCQFSNHTGYGSWSGSTTNGKQLHDLTIGLTKMNMLNNYTHLLTGYMSNLDFLNQFAAFLSEFTSNIKHKFFYLCDPVLGDNDKLYVPKEFIQVYKTKIIQHANIITPNQTEAHFLSDLIITDYPSAHSACKYFHNLGIETVVITSMKFAADPGIIHVIASEKSNPNSYLQLEIPQIGGYFSGTGDLTSALLLAWLTIDKNNLKTALEKTIATVQAVIQHTEQAKSPELLLVQSKKDIEEPNIIIHAKNNPIV